MTRGTGDGVVVNTVRLERLYHEAILKSDLDRMRKSLKVGQKVTWSISDSDKGQEKGQLKRRLGLRISGIYPHLVTARSERTGLTYSMTLQELVAEERKKDAHSTH